jgi:hypothetical protein
VIYNTTIRLVGFGDIPTQKRSQLTTKLTGPARDTLSLNKPTVSYPKSEDEAGSGAAPGSASSDAAKHQPRAQLTLALKRHDFSTHHNRATTPTTHREAATTTAIPTTPRNANRPDFHSRTLKLTGPAATHNTHRDKPMSYRKSEDEAGSGAAPGSAFGTLPAAATTGRTRGPRVTATSTAPVPLTAR